MINFVDLMTFAMRFSSRGYTDQAVNALLAARKHASEDRREIDPEHVLVGVAKLRRCAVRGALKNLGLDLGCEIEAITTLTTPHPLSPWEGPPSFSHRAEELLSRAEQNARDQGMKYVGPEQLILGLLSGTGPSADYLHGRGITSERFLAELKMRKTKDQV